MYIRITNEIMAKRPILPPTIKILVWFGVKPNTGSIREVGNRDQIQLSVITSKNNMTITQKE